MELKTPFEKCTNPEIRALWDASHDLNLMVAYGNTRTQVDERIMVGHPGDRTAQTVLSHIGAALGGNWYITDAGYLRLVTLNSAPAETSLLVDEYGDYITLGGVRIIV